jgi:hypothetical protein
MPLELILHANGSAELLRADVTVWSSDSDEAFKDEVSQEFLNEDDVPDILDYLVDAGRLTEEEADDCLIEEESFVTDEGEELEDDEAEDLGPADEPEGD